MPQFESGRATVSNLDPDSFAARSGIRNGDRLVSANGQILLGHTDWQRATLQFDPSRPFVLEVDRSGQGFTAALPLSAGVEEWRRSTQATGVLAFRLVQFGTLAFAMLVAFRRSFQGSALLGSLLLASLATISLAFRCGWASSGMRSRGGWRESCGCHSRTVLRLDRYSSPSLDFSTPDLAEAMDRRRSHPRRAGARLARVLGCAADAGSRATNRS